MLIKKLGWKAQFYIDKFSVLLSFSYIKDFSALIEAAIVADTMG
jgi:hypothetical protein